MVLEVKNLTASARATGDMGSIPGSGRSPGGEHGNTLQYAYLEKPMDRGAWWATAHEVAKSWTRLKRLACTHALLYICNFLIFSSIISYYKILSITACAIH